MGHSPRGARDPASPPPAVREFLTTEDLGDVGAKRQANRRPGGPRCGRPETGSERAIPADSKTAELIEASEAGRGGGLPAWFAQACQRLLLSDRIAFPVLAAILIGGLFAQLGAVINHDTAWYLHTAGKFLDGGRLYQDVFVEVNPPLGFFLTVPPVVLARLSGFFAVDLFVIYLYALTGLSLAATWRLLRSTALVSPVLGRGVIFLAALILTVCPADQFGQREHFLMVLALPYLTLVALRCAGVQISGPLAGIAGAAGIAAALGFALKPHYLLVPAALEVYRIVITGRMRAVLRPETVALAATCMLYAAALALFTPDYLTRIVPYGLRNPLWVNLWRAETILLPLGCLAQLATRRAQRLPGLADVFLIASVCFFVAYVVQMKGWSYHLYPASACLMLGYAAIFLSGLQDQTHGAMAAYAKHLGSGIVLGALVVVIMLVATDAVRGGYRNRFMETMTPHVEQHAAGGSIAIFTSNVWPGFPMVNYSGVGWSSRFPTLWLLPGAQQRRHASGGADTALLDEIEQFTRDAVVADLTRQPPDLVIVDNRAKKSYFGDLDFDYLEFFLEDPRFARIWAGYAWITDEGDYRLYRRRCAPDC
jgi:hypothetical protein